MSLEVNPKNKLSPQSYRQQHKRRLSWMPWLYERLKSSHKKWAKEWQDTVQEDLSRLETVYFGQDCFIAPEAQVFAEPGRDVVVGDYSWIAAEVFLHGPIHLGARVSINPRVHLDGGAAGIIVGDGSRLASGVHMYAFDHGMSADQPIRDQPVRSQGICIGQDVWVGANAGITDGVHIGDGAVVAMGAVVTRDVANYAVVGGVPARVLGDRRTWHHR